MNHTFTVCAYKESPFLLDCLASLKSQSVPSKIILCTSTPSQFLENIAKENKIELKINPKQAGIASDWNFALRQANTQYVTLAHQDDVYFPEFAEQTVNSLDKHADSLIAYTNYHEIVHTDTKIFTRRYSLNFMIKLLLNLTTNKNNRIKFGNPIGCPSVTYNLANIGDFSFSSEFSINMDWDAWYRLSKSPGSFVWVNQALMAHRIHIDSETSRGLAQNRRQEEDIIMFMKLWNEPTARALGQLYAISYKNN